MVEQGATAPLLARLGRMAVSTLVTAACILTLLALALMCWSVLDPTPLPVMVAMSVGQVVGTLGLALYLAAVVLYQLRLRSERHSGRPPES